MPNSGPDRPVHSANQNRTNCPDLGQTHSGHSEDCRDHRRTANEARLQSQRSDYRQQQFELQGDNRARDRVQRVGQVHNRTERSRPKQSRSESSEPDPSRSEPSDPEQPRPEQSESHSSKPEPSELELSEPESSGPETRAVSGACLRCGQQGHFTGTCPQDQQKTRTRIMVLMSRNGLRGVIPCSTSKAAIQSSKQSGPNKGDIQSQPAKNSSVNYEAQQSGKKLHGTRNRKKAKRIDTAISSSEELNANVGSPDRSVQPGGQQRSDTTLYIAPFSGLVSSCDSEDPGKNRFEVINCEVKGKNLVGTRTMSRPLTGPNHS